MATAAIPRLIQFQHCFLQLQRELLNTWPLGNQPKRHLAGKSRGCADRNNRENGQISSLSPGSWVVLPSASLVVTRGLLERTVSSLAAVESGSPRWFVHGWFFHPTNSRRPSGLRKTLHLVGKCWKSKKIPWPMAFQDDYLLENRVPKPRLPGLIFLRFDFWHVADEPNGTMRVWNASPGNKRRQTELRMCLFGP